MARSGSDKRKRQLTLAARFNEQEAAAIRQVAGKAGVSVAAVIRYAVLNLPPPRATRRPTVNHETVARLLGELGRIAETLRKAEEGGQLNPDHPVVAATLRDLAEMRVACFRALGREP